MLLVPAGCQSRTAGEGTNGVPAVGVIVALDASSRGPGVTHSGAPLRVGDVDPGDRSVFRVSA